MQNSKDKISKLIERYRRKVEKLVRLCNGETTASCKSWGEQIHSVPMISKVGGGASHGSHGVVAPSAFFVKEYFPVPSSGGNQCKNRHAPIWHFG